MEDKAVFELTEIFLEEILFLKMNKKKRDRGSERGRKRKEGKENEGRKIKLNLLPGVVVNFLSQLLKG